MDEQERKQALKQAKAARAPQIKAAAALAQQQKKDLARIKERLAQGPATPVELARDVGLTPREALWYLAAMRKYGMVSEAGKNGEYFNYQLVPQDPAAC
ncbi:MAG: hypothetical protein KQJ78_18625 [Deltaproteobacteria bacterium]|nr:hypothetical protein [Deltaproteobacteria bacterium]